MQVEDNYAIRNIRNGLRQVTETKLASISFFFLLLLVVLSVIGPSITPYQYDETQYTENGDILRGEPPSLAHPLGTNDVGQDVLSRIIYGVRPTVLTGAIGGFLVMTIGTTIGLISGYMGGRVDGILMRFTDLVYSIPIIPFALVAFALFQFGFFGTIVLIGLLLWRGPSRVIRSQALQIRERPFILAAKATGASTPRIIIKHVLPNVAPMAILYLALGVGWAILLQAGLAFIGVTDPFIPSWGVMIRNAYQSGQMGSLWWWAVPPGLLISLTVLTTFLIGRSLEEDSAEGSLAEGAGA